MTPVQPLNPVEPLGERGPTVGYVPGAWDMFHVGHLAILQRARTRCDRLVVGVGVDEYLAHSKGRLPVVPFDERMAVVASMSMVDEAVPDVSTDKRLAWRTVRFDVLFKGDDWMGTPKGEQLAVDMAEVGARLVYLPYTEGTSSTVLRSRLAS